MIVFKSEAANQMMVGYDQQGMAYVVERYTMEDIANMIEPDENNEAILLLGKLAILIEGAQKFQVRLGLLYNMWDQDGYWNEEHDKQKAPK